MTEKFVGRVAALLCLCAAIAAGQKPTPQQVQTALQNPAIAALVRSRIAGSGMTPDQIRARLRSAGFADTLLNAYLPGSGDSTSTPTTTAMSAVTFLGLVDQATQDSLAKVASGDTVATVVVPDTTAPNIYGLEIFRRATTQFQPDLAGPVDPGYRLGPHDVLVIMLTGGIESSYTLEVTREGYIVIPQVGQVYVANLTLDQATDVLYRRMRSVYSRLGLDANSPTRLFVSVAKLRVNQVFVVGDVQAPGSFPVSGAATMLTALYAAGGPSENGGMRDIQVRRGGKVVSHFDLYRYLVSGDVGSDLRLESGDVVFVPVHGPRAQVTGEVVRPAIYELAPGETLADLIHLAGGFTARANQRRVVINRIVPASQRTSAGSDRVVLSVSAISNGESAAAAFPMADGDSIVVYAVADRVRNAIDVSGAVWNPGSLGYTPGMQLSDAIRLAGGVRPDVKSVQISRLQSDQSRRELRTQFRDSLGTLANDLPLQEDDSIVVFAADDFRPDRYVIISGAVRKPGQFPYREGMTLRDLLHYAGGLDDGAYLDHAEIARLPHSRSAGKLATTIRAPMDSSYLFERSIDGAYEGPPGEPVAASGAPEIPLEAYDNVLILHQPDWSLDNAISVQGEVAFPGTYALTSKTEKLADLIRRAGGITRVGYPEGALLLRKSNGSRVAIDVPRALRDTAYRDNIVMQPDDSLYIPPYRSVVDVRGAVNSPISVAYNPGQNLRYYINAAGGLTYDADGDRAYVQQPNGVVDPHRHHAMWLDHDPTPLAGSVVVVPLQDPNAKKDWGQIAGSVAQILATTTTLIVVLTKVK